MFRFVDLRGRRLQGIERNLCRFHNGSQNPCRPLIENNNRRKKKAFWKTTSVLTKKSISKIYLQY